VARWAWDVTPTRGGSDRILTLELQGLRPNGKPAGEQFLHDVAIAVNAQNKSIWARAGGALGVVDGIPLVVLIGVLGFFGYSAVRKRGRIGLAAERVAARLRGERRALKVFISYRRSDSGGYARNVYDTLAQRFGSEHVFYDVHSVAPGRDFVDVLNETLRKADVVLVVLGPTWAASTNDAGDRRIDDPSDYVRIEVESALVIRELLVIPVLVGGAKMPSEQTLPDSLKALTRRNATSLVDEHWRATLEALVDILRHLRDELERGHLTPST